MTKKQTPEPTTYQPQIIDALSKMANLCSNGNMHSKAFTDIREVDDRIVLKLDYKNLNIDDKAAAARHLSSSLRDAWPYVSVNEKESLGYTVAAVANPTLTIRVADTMDGVTAVNKALYEMVMSVAASDSYPEALFREYLSPQQAKQAEGDIAKPRLKMAEPDPGAKAQTR